MPTSVPPWEQMAMALDAWEIGTYEWKHAEGQFTASARFLELYGLAAAADPLAILTAVHPDDRGRVEAAFRVALEPEGCGHINLVHRALLSDGKIRWLHLRSQTSFEVAAGLRRPKRTLGSVMDVSERQQIEQELRRSESRIEEAVRGAQFGIFEHNHIDDPHAENVYWSPRLREILGVGDDETGSARRLISRIPLEDLELLHPAVARAHDPKGDGYYDVEHRYLHPILGTRWLLTRSSTYFGVVGGKQVPVRTVGAMVDVTARRKSEQEQEQRAQIMDATSDFVAMAEPDGRLVYLNRAGRELLGFGPTEDLGGRSLHSALAPSSLSRLLSEGLPAAARDGVWRVEAEFRRHDGAIVPMSQVLLSHRGRDGHVELYSTIARDISRERQLEENARQSQKLEAVGRLAGGIAHDFNNMLCALLGLAQLAADEVGPGGKAYPELQEIITVGERAAALTQQLLSFSRRQILRPRVVDVSAVIARMSPMIGRLLGEEIELTVSEPPEPLRVKVDPTQLEQVVLNLAINGRDAMENGGRLAIASGPRHLDAAPAARLELPAGDYAVILVADDGIGMDAQTRARVFEPFFTTKGPRRGTGLGLATVFGIVKQSDGTVVVQSEVGRGSVFEVYLPISDEPLTEEPVPVKLSGRSRNALILVTEDDPSVRHVVVTVLKRADYRVLEAADPHHALDLARAHPRPIDLLLTDVVMPVMSGKDLARQLRVQRPDLRVLFMSGYSDEVVAHHGVLDVDAHLLAKPVSPDQLLKAVSELLERR